MREKLFFLIFIFFFLINSSEAKIDKYKRGDLISGEIKLNNKKSIYLPEGNWEVYYRSTEHFAGMLFNVLSLGKIENNEIIEFVEIGYSNLAGMHIMYVDPAINEVIFEDKNDGCYDRSEYYILELYRNGSTHNCFIISHIDVNKELNNPDEKFNTGYLSPLKNFINNNDGAKLPNIMLQSIHSYFSRTTGGDWFLLQYLIDPKKLDAPKNNFFSEDTSEYHKYNIERYPDHKKIMDKWISISAIRHQELEQLAKSKSIYRLNLDRYILNGTKNNISKKKIEKNLSNQLKDLNDLFKSGVLTKSEFEKAKKKILD